MTILQSVSTVFLGLFLFSCSNTAKVESTETPVSKERIELSKAQEILNEAIAAHGGELYRTAHYSFVFRGNTYQFKNEGSNYEYTKVTVKGDSTITDVLTNGDFKRMVNGIKMTLEDEAIAKGTGAINSVIYFATLPYKLNDEAVNVSYLDTVRIKNKNYDVLEITFNQEGGGEDHDDQYFYWVNKETKKIDYLAYNYKVNKGGVRFRSAYNKRVVDGITFQDYVNYKAEVGTPLKNLPALYEANELEELSKIETENVLNLKKDS